MIVSFLFLISFKIIFSINFLSIDFLFFLPRKSMPRIGIFVLFPLSENQLKQKKKINKMCLRIQ